MIESGGGGGALLQKGKIRKKGRDRGPAISEKKKKGGLNGGLPRKGKEEYDRREGGRQYIRRTSAGEYFPAEGAHKFTVFQKLCSEGKSVLSCKEKKGVLGPYRGDLGFNKGNFQKKTCGTRRQTTYHEVGTESGEKCGGGYPGKGNCQKMIGEKLTEIGIDAENLFDRKRGVCFKKKGKTGQTTGEGS